MNIPVLLQIFHEYMILHCKTTILGLHYAALYMRILYRSKIIFLPLVDLATKYIIVVELENKENNTIYIALTNSVDNSFIPFNYHG